MTKKKSTKRALISSLLILAMCFTMLAGTTFAWFTDSVESGNNIIKSGKLDMEVQYWNGTAWADLDNTVELFDDAALYEPGYTQVAYIKIANVGTLAFKYALSAKINSETEGVSANGTFKLSDYLMFGTVETNAVYATREDARAAVAANAKALKELNANNSGYLLAPAANATSETGIIALVIYMPETVGNEANYTTTAPEINLGLTIAATQYTYESDSFNELYDIAATADATAADATELAAAIAAANDGDVILLTGDVTTPVAIDKDVTIVGDGNDLKATITGDVDVKLVDVDTKDIEVTNFSGTLEFNGGTLVSNTPQGTSDTDAAFYYQSTGGNGGTFIFKNMNIEPTQTKGIKIAKAAEVIIDNCSFTPDSLADPNDPTVFNPWARSLSMIDIQEQNTDGKMKISITNCEFKNVPAGSLMNGKTGTDTAAAIKIKSEKQGFESVTISGNTFVNCYRDIVGGVNLNRNGTGWLSGKTPELFASAYNDVDNWTIANNTSDGTADKMVLIAANQARTQGYAEAIGRMIGGAAVYNAVDTTLTITTDAIDAAIAAFNA